MGLRNSLARLLDRWRAWRRGERRVAPHAVRGRVYRRREDDEEPGRLATKAKGSVSISARVFRADGTVEDLGKISRGRVG